MKKIIYSESSRFNINKDILGQVSRAEYQIDKTELVEKSRKKTLAIAKTVYPK